MENGIGVRAYGKPWGDEIAFLVSCDNSVVTVLEFEKREKYTQSEPTFSMSHESAQELMNDLWKEGLRPKNASDYHGEMKATERHLRDLQKLVFDKKGTQDE